MLLIKIAGMPPNGQGLRFYSELGLPASTDTDAQSFSSYQSSNAKERISTSQSSVGQRVGHHRDSTYASHSSADELWQAHRAQALLLLSRRGNLLDWHRSIV